MSKLLMTAIAAAALMLGSNDQGKETGFGEDQESTQGNSGNTNDNANEDNEGQLKQDNTNCNNGETTVIDLSGKNR